MSQSSGLVEAMERHQVAVYIGAMAAGGLVGWVAPSAGPGLEHAINPVLAVLLYVTFLQVPAADLLRSLRAGRFLTAALVVNFVVVPLVVAAMFPFLPADQAVRPGMLLVLLAPCVDYVIVFSGLMRRQQPTPPGRDPAAPAGPDDPAALVPVPVHGLRSGRRRGQPARSSKHS